MLYRPLLFAAMSLATAAFPVESGLRLAKRFLDIGADVDVEPIPDLSLDLDLKLPLANRNLLPKHINAQSQDGISERDPQIVDVDVGVSLDLGLDPLTGSLTDLTGLGDHSPSK